MHSGNCVTGQRKKAENHDCFYPVNNCMLYPQGFRTPLSFFHDKRAHWSDVTVVWRIYLRKTDSISFRKNRSWVCISECKVDGDTHVTIWIKCPLFCESRGCFDKPATDFNHRWSFLMRNVCLGSNLHENKAWYVCMYLCQMNIHDSWVILTFLQYNLEWRGLSTADLKMAILGIWANVALQTGMCSDLFARDSFSLNSMYVWQLCQCALY